MLQCDVLVVGAGPAGSLAARAAALNGAKVVLIERNERAGKIACGEAVSSLLIPYLPFKIPREQLIWKTTGISFNATDMHVERHGKLWESYSVDRKEFDYWLCNEAVRMGAKLITNAELVDLEHEKYSVRKAIVRTAKEDMQIEPGLVIAADGVESRTLQLLGLYEPKEQDIAEILSFEMENVKVGNPFLEQIFIGEFIDGGYAYLFPKSKNKINIGVGSVYEQNLEKSFEEFSETPQVKKQLEGSKVVVEKSGKAPVVPFLSSCVYGNVLVAGDAACQNLKPFVEGILSAVVCGDICGKIAALSLKKKADLGNYERLVKNRMGPLFKESDRIARVIYDLFTMKDRKKFLLLLAVVSHVCSYAETERMKDSDYSEIKSIIERKSKSTLGLRLKEELEHLYLAFQRVF